MSISTTDLVNSLYGVLRRTTSIILCKIENIAIVTILLFCLIGCNKEHAVEKAKLSLIERPSPLPQDAVLNTIAALNIGDSLGVLSTFVSSLRPFVYENFDEIHSIMFDNDGTVKTPWEVNIIKVDVDSTNKHSAVVMFSIQAGGTIKKFKDSLYQPVVFEEGHWRHERFRLFEKEEYLKKNNK